MQQVAKWWLLLIAPEMVCWKEGPFSHHFRRHNACWSNCRAVEQAHRIVF